MKNSICLIFLFIAACGEAISSSEKVPPSEPVPLEVEAVIPGSLSDILGGRIASFSEKQISLTHSCLDGKCVVLNEPTKDYFCGFCSDPRLAKIESDLALLAVESKTETAAYDGCSVQHTRIFPSSMRVMERVDGRLILQGVVSGLHTTSGDGCPAQFRYEYQKTVNWLFERLPIPGETLRIEWKLLQSVDGLKKADAKASSRYGAEAVSVRCHHPSGNYAVADIKKVVREGGGVSLQAFDTKRRSVGGGYFVFRLDLSRSGSFELLPVCNALDQIGTSVESKSGFTMRVVESL